MIAASVAALRQPSRVGGWTSRVRSVLWRAVCWALGGLTVTGELPRRRAYVVVANHSSHADTAALLAALPPASRPVFAAAADYWFDVPVRRAAASGLAGILPVRRGEGGAYAALLAAAQPALAAGRAVVVYPEGTRSTDGQVGEFHSGAVRLAADCGVALVPVAVLGTREVLPKHGRVRSAPMEVRIGAPRAADTTDAGRLRADVLDLLDRGPARRRVSPVWERVARLVGSRRGLLLAFLWGLGEAPRWPVMAEMTLVFLAAAVPSRVPVLASSIVGGSLAGVLLNARLTAMGWWLPAPLTTERMQAAARADLADGAPGVLHQALNGIPVKLFAQGGGQAGHRPVVAAGVGRGGARVADGRGRPAGVAGRPMAAALVAPLLRHLPGTDRHRLRGRAGADHRGVGVGRR